MAGRKPELTFEMNTRLQSNIHPEAITGVVILSECVAAVTGFAV
jgi:hypothetical protein